MIDLFYPYVPEDAIDEVCKTLHTRWIGQWERVDQFENEFSIKFGQRYCLSLNSGSSALETAYELVGINEGDEVISSPLTCTATNIPLLRMKAKIVWADINPDTLCLDRNDVLRKITPKTKVIVNVHLGGIENDLGKMPVEVIDDSCQALGVFTGQYTCNSFQAIKHITTGDGGMLTIDNENKYKRAKLMRWFGIDREKKISNNWQAYTQRQMTFDINLLGYKRHMNDIAAGMGIWGLKHYDYIIAHRRKLFELYKDNLKGIKVIDGKKNTYWLCTILVENRDDFARKMFDYGIDTNLVQVRNDVYSVFGSRAELPYLDSIEDKYISIPLNMRMVPDDVSAICNVINAGW